MEHSMPRGETLAITQLPTEMISHVFAWLDPVSFSTTKRVCRLFYDIIKGNQSLFRKVYLLQMDKPAHELEMDWEEAVLNLLQLDHVFKTQSKVKGDYEKLNCFPFVCNTVIRILRDASLTNNSPDPRPNSQNVSYLRDLFGDEASATAFMQQSSLFQRIKYKVHTGPRNTSTKEEHQLSAKLHCLYGKPILQAGRTRSAMTYPYACSRVYDMRQHTALTKWGPFRNDPTGRVDWEKIEAISIVLGKNVKGLWSSAGVFDDIWDTPFFGSFPRSFVPNVEPKLEGLDLQDPYGIAGSWYRVVCYLDYSDFFQFNFTLDSLIPTETPRPPLHVGEATRLIAMKLHVISIEPPGPEDGQALPVVHFEGESYSIDESMDDNANSDIRGSVRLTKEGEVRWNSVSVFNGEERWASEGIQVGGIKSARGVVGTWFDRDHDIHGPCGPTAFWKAADNEDPRRALLDGMSSIFTPGPGGLTLPGGSPHSSIDALDYFADEDEEDDDWDADLEPIQNELPGLLEDAEMDLDTITHHGQMTGP